MVSSSAWAATLEYGIAVKPPSWTGLHPGAGPSRVRAGLYQPVVTLNGRTAPFRMNNGVNEFHLLVAEPVEREMADGKTAYLWGYNGQSPARQSRPFEGDRVRIFVTTICLNTHDPLERHDFHRGWMGSAGFPNRIFRS